MNRPTILLNPGPVTLSNRVRHALARADQCHREPDFARFMLEITDALSRVYPGSRKRFEPVVLTGSGTCAVEAMLSSLVPRDGLTLVVSNGVYGERMADMIRNHGKPMEQIRCDWLQPMDLVDVEKRLAAGDITHVVAVHNETTTGRLNDIAALGKLCRKYDAALLLDAVSSFGAESIDFSGWNLQALAATANKCLHGVPGIAFVLVDQDVMDGGSSYSSTLYLDLYRYHREQKTGFSPFTPAVHACFALHEALLELEEMGGREARQQRYRYLSGRIRQALIALGIRPLLPEESCCSMISSFLLPKDISYPQLHGLLLEAGFVIYAGQGELAKSIFRIANMGDIQDQDLEHLIATFRQLMER